MFATLPSPFVAKPIHSFSPQKTLTVRNSATATASHNTSTSATALALSLYDVLKVERTASLIEIKTAYRSLAKVYHPDAIGSSSDGRDFIEIQNAYATLSDPMTRAVYDMSLGARARRARSRVYPTRKWETDQCW